MTHLTCNDCGLRYDVVWNNDGDIPPVEFCPRCGETDITQEPLEDDE